MAKPLFRQDADFFDPNARHGYRPLFEGDKGPPAGIPENFWREIVQSEYGQHLINQGKSFGPDGLYDAFVRDVGNDWGKLNPTQKSNYQQDQDSNALNPWYSPEAKIDAAKSEAKAERDRTDQAYQDWEDQFMPGLREAMSGADAGDSIAIARLNQMLGGIQDPELAQYIGDYASKAAEAGASREAIDRQRGQFDKLNALSDPTLTAEERLMQEISRREQEQDLRSARGAIANNLQERGVYGSGQELTMALMSQQEGAQRRALDEMAAQANAQRRAMDALGKATDLSSTIRGDEVSESQFRGEAADIAAKFNGEMRTRYNEWKTNEQRKNNADKIGREEKIAGNVQQIFGNKLAREKDLANTALTATGGRTNTRLAFSEPVHKYTGMDIAEADNEETEDKINS